MIPVLVKSVWQDDKNRHFVLLIIDISKHGAKEMGNVKMAGPGFVNDVMANDR
jgi:hypothetical protein